MKRGPKPRIDWTMVDWSKGTTELAKSLNIVPSQVSHMRKKLGHPPLRRGPKGIIDFDSIDWNVRDRALARIYGASNSTFAKERKRRGLPRGTVGHACWSEEAKKRHRKIDPATIDWRKMDMELSKIHGVTRERIRQLRIAAGLPSSQFIPRYKFKWIATEDWSKSNSSIAKKRGLSVCQIATIRKEHGKTMTFERDVPRYDWSMRTRDIAKLLGCQAKYVSNYRYQRKQSAGTK